MIENELKLDVPGGFRLPSLDGIEGVRASAPATKLLSTVYWDTHDHRVARWDCSLRYRAGEGWTVKLRDDGDDHELMRRIEITMDGEAGTPAAGAVDILRACIRTADLHPAATLLTNRTTVKLSDAHDTEQAEVVNDSVVVEDGPLGRVVFQEVEIELREHTPTTLLDEVVARLRDAGAGAVGRVSKQERALGRAGPPEIDLGVPPPGAGRALLARHAVAVGTAGLVRADAPVRIAQDDAGARNLIIQVVALRRQLQAFADVLGHDTVAGIDERLEPLTAAADRATLLALLRERAYAEVLDDLVELAAGLTE